MISPNLYRIVVPLIRRKGQPMFNRRSFCNTFTLQPRMAAYTCSSTHAHGTAGTCVKSTDRRAPFISQQLLITSGNHQLERNAVQNFDIDDTIPQPAELIEEAYKLLLEICTVILRLPIRRQAQLDRLKDHGF